jgi:paraquat-inducible protein A
MRRKLSILSWPRRRGIRHQAVCHVCDTLHEAPTVPEGVAARCCVCRAVLYQNRPASLARATAFSITALLLMVVVHTTPFLTMQTANLQTSLSPIAAVRSLIAEGSAAVGWAIAFFTIIAPLTLSCGLIYLCGPLLRGHAAPGAVHVARLMHRTEPWNMIEVFLFGILVSLLKLGHMAELEFGTGFWAFVALMVCMAAAAAGIDRNELWDRLEVARS